MLFGGLDNEEEQGRQEILLNVCIQMDWFDFDVRGREEGLID